MYRWYPSVESSDTTTCTATISPKKGYVHHLLLRQDLDEETATLAATGTICGERTAMAATWNPAEGST